MSVFKKPEPSAGPSATRAQYLRISEPEVRGQAKGQDPKRLDEMKCPECASTEVRRMSVVFEAGTTTTSGVAVGMTGASDIGVGVVGGTQQSLLALRLRPPADPSRRSFWHGFLMSVVAFVVLLGLIVRPGNGVSLFLAVAGSLTVGVCVYVWSVASSTPKHEAALARWRKQWCCMRCGHAFVLDSK
jgi:ribosomal protein L37AE/L43A